MTDQSPEHVSKHVSERERRALAYEQRGQVVDETAEEVAPRRLAQMVSLRLDGEILATLRDIADRRGVSVSDLLREGVDCVISRWTGSEHVAHIWYTTSAGPRRSMTGAYDVLVRGASAADPPS